MQASYFGREIIAVDRRYREQSNTTSRIQSHADTVKVICCYCFRLSGKDDNDGDGIKTNKHRYGTVVIEH